MLKSDKLYLIIYELYFHILTTNFTCFISFSNEKYDFVFLQEIWYEKDYDFLANCTKTNYNISNYDWDSCGAANEVSHIVYSKPPSY